MQTKFPLHFHLTILLLGAMLFCYVLVVGSFILIPLTFAALISLFLMPICKKLEHFRFPRWLAILVSLLLIVIVIAAILSLIYSNLRSFTADIPQMKSRTKELIVLMQNTIEAKFAISSEKQLLWLKENLDGFINAGGDIINNLLNSMTTFFSQLFIIPVYCFFLLYYRHIFKNFLHAIIDQDYKANAVKIEEQVQQVIQKYIVGLFSVIALIAVLNVAGLLAIGLPHAVFFGILAAFLTVIPYIGIAMGAALPILYALVMTDSFYYPLAVLIWFVIVQALEGNLITPNIVGSQVSVNPLVAMLALLIGGNMWGISGMILFVPLTAMLKVVLDNIPELAPYGYLLGEGEKTKAATGENSWWLRIKELVKRK
jgi:putative heme transporter